MNNSQNSNNFGDWAWENSGDLVWNEKDCRKYLNQIIEDEKTFQINYTEFFNLKDRLDKTALYMGWINQDTTQISDIEEFKEFTVHSHPVFIATRALVKIAYKNFIESKYKIENELEFILNLKEAEHFLIMSISAFDLDDFALSLCQAKDALTCLNKSFNSILDNKNLDNLKSILFDIREIILRIINDSRLRV